MMLLVVAARRDRRGVRVIVNEGAEREMLGGVDGLEGDEVRGVRLLLCIARRFAKMRKGDTKFCSKYRKYMFGLDRTGDRDLL